MLKRGDFVQRLDAVGFMLASLIADADRLGMSEMNEGQGRESATEILCTMRHLDFARDELRDARKWLTPYNTDKAVVAALQGVDLGCDAEQSKLAADVRDEARVAA